MMITPDQIRNSAKFGSRQRDYKRKVFIKLRKATK
jgi:hypothetical protein